MRHPNVNSDVRKAIADRGLCIWQVADLIGCHYMTLNGWLRVPLTAERRERIENALAQYDSVTAKTNLRRE